MTDGTDRPHSPQPEPGAPDNGGYGYPQGQVPADGYGYPQPGQQPGAGGYGYPPAPGGFGPPPGGPAEQPAGYGYPQAGPYQQGPYQQAPFEQAPFEQGPGTPFPTQYQPPADEPDWAALADGAARERRRKRMWAIGGGVTVLALLAGGGAYALLGSGGSTDDAKPSASSPAPPSPSPSGGGSKPAADAPTVAGDPTQLRDRSGKSHLKMGSEASVVAVDKRFEFRTTGGENSYAESEKALIDVAKSFTVSARVSNSAPKGRQIAVSQGNQKTFSFELGSDEVNGKQVWIFRVQTDAAGTDATTKTVVAEGRKVDNTLTELTGTYDAKAKKISLYINGKAAGETPVPTLFRAPGSLELGRTRAQDKWTGGWTGAMDTVRVYRIALSPEQVLNQQPGKLDPSIRPFGSWLLF
ncbi:hypothetical protein OG389_21725 [Streptomyces sp. NBC_00435]|uniref:LamG domain-containing protein n=1 Tax=Streptomyces sp. NBC_00435 TaxID=2903649 RepID=UPI002E21EA40